MAGREQPFYTPEQYLAFEDAALEKHEYYAGRVYAMSGASVNHIRIAGNVFATLYAQLRGRTCEAFGSDVKVRVQATGLYTYPDVSALCGAPRFDEHGTAILLDPSVIVEVLSPSTESYDRGEKFAHYRQVESLREYVLVSQDEPRVERFTRGDGASNEWTLAEAHGLDASIALPSIDCVLASSDVYARVTFPTAPPLRAVHEASPEYATF